MINIEVQGRNILVTGGSRGIGRAIALALAGEGANVAICGRTRETLEATAAEIRGHGVAAWPVVADVSRSRTSKPALPRRPRRWAASISWSTTPLPR